MGFAVYETKYGPWIVEYNDAAITRFTVGTTAPDKTGQRTELTDLAYQQLEEYLSGKRKDLNFPTECTGTPFQKLVWEALKTIPYGETRSYKEIAQQIGHPKAYRAVGQANHCNPLIIIVPCHRVIGSSGAPVGYACGMNMKLDLLALEQKHKKSFR